MTTRPTISSPLLLQYSEQTNGVFGYAVYVRLYDASCIRKHPIYPGPEIVNSHIGKWFETEDKTISLLSINDWYAVVIILFIYSFFQASQINESFTKNLAREPSEVTSVEYP